MSETDIRLARILEEAANVVREKNANYGSSWRTQGWRGNLSRILEKSARLRSMLWRANPELMNGAKEHPRETALDMINTLSFMIINMDDGVEWGNESNTEDIARLDRQSYYSGQSPNPVRVDPFEPDSGPAMTQINQHVGQVPTPGEELQESYEHESDLVMGRKPSPVPRKARRPVKDQPQA